MDPAEERRIEKEIGQDDAKAAYTLWAEKTWGEGASKKRPEKARRRVGGDDDPELERERKPGKRARKRNGMRETFYTKDEKLRVAEKRFRDAGKMEDAKKISGKLQTQKVGGRS
eukprot:CAMPEP_0184325776 /NCGR_PEP_ID=MMETSP1049-20130417/142142_1 /TAXON_ID=77928 /ORGANISM="Proteomonas sulcata, Strain CCMP704" /LENGTH=113 /DNA_ID=CAMNT_0026647929 /DNA_START=207 /DNA_END=548 /DNA_ORIENTATION=+